MLRHGCNLPLQWGYVPHFLVVEKKGGKEARQRFEKRTAKNNWTVPELQQAILLEYPRESGHGRRMKPPSTPAVGLDQLAMQAEGMVKRCGHVLEYLEGLPESRRRQVIRARAKAVSVLFDELAAAAASAGKRLRRW